MNTDEFIEQELRGIRDGFDLSQIRSEVLIYTLKQCIGILSLDATIDRAMKLYAEIINRAIDEKK